MSLIALGFAFPAVGFLAWVPILNMQLKCISNDQTRLALDNHILSLFAFISDDNVSKKWKDIAINISDNACEKKTAASFLNSLLMSEDNVPPNIWEIIESENSFTALTHVLYSAIKIASKLDEKDDYYADNLIKSLALSPRKSAQAILRFDYLSHKE